MIKKILSKISLIYQIVINAPLSLLVILSNFISSFLSIIGIPILVVAYKFSENEISENVPLFKNLIYIFEFLGINLNFYTLITSAIILIIFGQTCLGFVEILNRYIQIKVVKNYSINLIKYYKNSNWNSILEDKSGKFQYAMNIESQRSSQVVLDSLRFASCIIQLFFFIGTSFYFSPKITIILIIFFIFLGIITILFSLKISALANFFNLEKIKIAEYISNINNNKKYLKSSIFTNFFNNIYYKIKFAWNIDWKLNLYTFFLRYLIFNLIAIFFVFLLIFYKEIGSEFEEVIIAILIFLRTTPVFIKISESYGSLSEAVPVYENFFKRVNKFKKSKEKNGSYNFNDNDTIKFENVSFKYPSSKKFVIQNLSIDIHSNKAYAVIGPSGSGKSTLIDLLMGLFRPTSGSIYYGRINQKNINFDNLRKKVSYISQNITLFDGTIKENLLMGEKRTNREIIAACKLAMAFDFVNAMPKKLNTNIGENAVKISGGQKQRILLARAILANTKIIIMDEATNQLDEKSLKYINNAIKKLKSNKTIIIVSHQKEVKNLADKVIYLKKII